MILLNQVTMESVYSNGQVVDRYVTAPLSLNEKSIVSIKPAGIDWGLIKEINNSPVEFNNLTEIVYNAGSNPIKVVVLAEYSEIMDMVNGEDSCKRAVLCD